MKYIIPQEKLEKIVFRYLDAHYGDLEIHKKKYTDSVFLKKPNDNSVYVILVPTDSFTLYVSNTLLREIASKFSLSKQDSNKFITNWVRDKFILTQI